MRTSTGSAHAQSGHERHHEDRAPLAKRHAHKKKVSRSGSHHDVQPKLPIRQALTAIRAMATRGVTIVDLTRAAGVSRATMYRLLAECKCELGMRIECEGGVYTLRDWGFLNRRRVLK